MKAKEIGLVVFSTFFLILLGDGVVASAVLGPKLTGPAYNWNTIALGWGLAVVFAGLITGGHNNPAVTLAFAIRGDLPWSKVVPYIIAEFVGGFLGALCVYLVYRDGLVAAGMPNVWTSGAGNIYAAASAGGVSGTPTGSYSLVTASVAEFFGTVVLMWGILATSDKRNASVAHLGALLVGGIVLAIGICLGGPSGYAINPARDLAPRLLGLLVGTQGLFDGIYWLVPPVLVPFVAAPIGTFIYDKFGASE
jgi:glycerol uptake facilitator protein